MPRIHDVGGMHGFGSAAPDADDVEHVWESWEARVWGLTRALRHNGVHSSDEFRHAIESLPPAQYISAGYYERWLAALERMLVGKGLLADGELDQRVQAAQAAEAAAPAQQVPPREPSREQG